MEKINISELLKDCPQGMELDCTMFENVTFEGIKQDEYPIIVKTKEPSMTLSLTETGGWNLFNDAKCVIFPKGKTTWEGFQRPFKDGDVISVIVNKNLWYGIYQKEFDTILYCYVSYSNSTESLYHSRKAGMCLIDDIAEIRLATEEEKQKLFDAIKENGYKWNPETKTLEKLLKFKVGDRVKLKNSRFIFTITDLLKDRYRATIDSRDLYEIEFERQDAYILVPNKFDITTLKAFESRVLVRDTDTDAWKGAFYSHYKSKKFYTIGSSYYYQCIPYEGHEHLLDTTNDCDDFYKTWEK